jgi:hypothetical protein
MGARHCMARICAHSNFILPKASGWRCMAIRNHCAEHANLILLLVRNFGCVLGPLASYRACSTRSTTLMCGQFA